ncbi:28S ribosomal protein S18a, mitochondrial-like [Eriocheir sinensis]|uniref:28S ribosomal protein S18a, mitochondrial-like n=1 Tax=Eriocheir sinensis TaxID=95602 RepID=UPI0021CA2880|nr:28S ribosomal protein S18a, mitochondrial-like [Eriocheir sinensis]
MAARIVTSLPRLLPPMASTITRLPLSLPHAHTHARLLHASQVHRLKEILVVEEDNENVKVEGRYLPSPNTGRLVKCEEGEEAAPACPLCALNLDVKHTDVLILSQFMTREGGVLPRRITGLCAKQQRRINWLIIMAQKAGLMPNLAPVNSKRDPRRRYGSKKHNRYFDEDTLPK